MLDQFQLDCRAGVITFLPLNDSVFERVESFYLSAPANSPLRASTPSTSLALPSTVSKEVYSNDRHFLAAAPLFV